MKLSIMSPSFRLFALRIIFVLFFVIGFGMSKDVIAEDGVADTYIDSEEAQRIQEQLNRDLATSLSIQPFHRERVSTDLVNQIPIAPNEQGQYLVRKLIRIGLDPSPSLIGYRENEDVIRVRGETIPGALVTLSIRSDMVLQEVARADATGEWTIIFLVNTIPEGEHIASVRSSFQNILSEEKEIATFIVIGTDGISNTTWAYIVLIGALTVVLLIVVNIHLYHRRRSLEKTAASPPAVNKRSNLTPPPAPSSPSSLEHRD